jgi:hypothetical protein
MSSFENPATGVPVCTSVNNAMPGPAFILNNEREVDNQAAAPAETRTPNWHRASFSMIDSIPTFPSPGDFYFSFFPSRPLIAFAGFPLVAAIASPNSPCAMPPATPFMSGMK